jgi:hypothetical protein
MITRSVSDLGAVQAIRLACPMDVGLASRGRPGQACTTAAIPVLVLTVLVPVVGIVPFALIAFVFPGESETNKYGAPPFDLADAAR